MGQMDKVEAQFPILPPTLNTQPFPDKNDKLNSAMD